MTEKLVIFDCDGVLVDSELISLGLLIEYCSKYDVEVSLEEACEIFLGKPVKDSASEVNLKKGTNVPDVDLNVFQEQILERFDKELNAVEGVYRALEQINNRVCVASSSNLDRIGASLEKTNLSKFFTGSLFSTDMVARGKPHPDVFLFACERMNVHPQDAIVIEDSPAGLMAAKAAGIRTIAFAGGVHAKPAKLVNKLLPRSPDILIHNMMELPPLIDSLLME